MRWAGMMTMTLLERLWLCYTYCIASVTWIFLSNGALDGPGTYGVDAQSVKHSM